MKLFESMKKNNKAKASDTVELLLDKFTECPPDYDAMLRLIQNEIDINMEYGDDPDERSLLANIIDYYPRPNDENDKFEYGVHLNNIVGMFIDNGFDVKKYGFECLHMLCWSVDDQWILPIAERLIDCGASLDDKNEEGDSILDLIHWRVSDWMDGELKHGNLFSAYYQMVDQAIDGDEYHGIRAWEACKGKRIEKVEIMREDYNHDDVHVREEDDTNRGMILWCEGLPLYIIRYLAIYVNPFYKEEKMRCIDVSKQYTEIVGKSISDIIFFRYNIAFIRFNETDTVLVKVTMDDHADKEKYLKTELKKLSDVDGSKPIILKENEMDNENKNWRFCVVGNIVKTHLDEEGVVRYGTKAFTGGTKVYIPWKWNYIDDNDGTLVIGLNRFHRFALEPVDFEWLENIRFQIVFKTTVLRIIGWEEAIEGFESWGRTANDKRGAKAFAERLTRRIEYIKNEEKEKNDALQI